MAIKMPLLCCSHTVRGTATVRATLDGTGYDITVPEGTYWVDPVYNDATLASDLVDLPGQLAHLYESSAAPTLASTVGYTQISTPYNRGFYYAVIDPAITVSTSGSHANTTTAGRAIIQRLGGNPFGANGWDDAGFDGQQNPVLGTWCPQRGESGDVDENDDGFGSVSRTHGGVTYPFNLGSPQARRLLTLRGIAGALTVSRVGILPWSLRSHIWRYASAGEKIRYYADIASTRTYLTTALTSTSATVVVKSTTGISAGETIWVDGEVMSVITVDSGTNLTVLRDATIAIAHVKYSPVSDSFVATYALDDAIGNINQEEFTPLRPDVRVDRWDIDIGLLRSLS